MQRVAIKFILKKYLAKTNAALPSEIRLLRALSKEAPPGIIEYIDDDEDENTFYLVMQKWGTEWSSSNPILYLRPHPGLVAQTDVEVGTVKKSCDLFDCIDLQYDMLFCLGSSS